MLAEELQAEKECVSGENSSEFILPIPYISLVAMELPRHALAV